ncbi:MAG: hypothetical protein M3264_08155 [Thermoproteota archaeon]|nr:hypothetical protein [Thermoproteota archaeon]
MENAGRSQMAEGFFK